MGVAKLTDQNTIVPQSKYARVERERRYLLQDLPEGLTRAEPHLQITDNYITGTRLRLRKVREPRTNKWTVKFTQKNRYRFESEGREFTIDMFLGDLFGLVLAEVSFEKDEELDSFAKPPFAVADVTDDPFFTGGSLCELKFADVRQHIVDRGLLKTR